VQVFIEGVVKLLPEPVPTVNDLLLTNILPPTVLQYTSNTVGMVVSLYLIYPMLQWSIIVYGDVC